MEDFDLDIVAKKSVKGVFALVSRTFLIQLLGVVTSFILAVYLTPSAFGVFFIVSAIVTFFNYFADIGLAASLIQKKEEPTQEELRTVFTFQQILVLLIVIPAFLLSLIVEKNFHIGKQGLYLYYAFLISFLLSSLKTIPTILLERRLDFHKLVIPQIAENLFYNLALIIFAVKGFGVGSFTVAVLGRGIIGLVAMYIVAPWRPGIAFHRQSLRKLLSFGLPFQLNSFLALAKDNLISIYIGKILPLAQVGYIGFAQKWAYMPLRLILDNVVKVIFPSFSRLQHDEGALKTVIERSLFIIAALMFPVAVVFITLSPKFIEFIPKYHKWEPALIALGLFSLDALFGSLSTPITNLLSAIGKVRKVLYFMTGLTIFIWISTPFLIHEIGYNGMPLASALTAFVSMSIYFVARKYIKFSFLKPLLKPMAVTVVISVLILAFQGLISSLILLVAFCLFLAAVYFTVLSVLSRKEIASAISLFRETK
jgi:O-antigen/teichoic acid export membrane protein